MRVLLLSVLLLPACSAVRWAVGNSSHANQSPSYARPAQPKDIRDIMLESAKQLDSNFANEKDVKLTSFAYMCKVTVDGSAIHVVHEKNVLTGMPAPRGIQYISLFDASGTFMTKHRLDYPSTPLWCDGDKIFMFGRYQGPLYSDGCAQNCNVVKIDAKGGATLHYEKSYGSSGGIEDKD